MIMLYRSYLAIWLAIAIHIATYIAATRLYYYHINIHIYKELAISIPLATYQ